MTWGHFLVNGNMFDTFCTEWVEQVSIYTYIFDLILVKMKEKPVVNGQNIVNLENFNFVFKIACKLITAYSTNFRLFGILVVLCIYSACLSTRKHVCKLYCSMTQLLSHIIAHFTWPSFMLKANNLPYKKFLGLAFSWVNVVKYCKILTFKVNFLCQKLSKFFQKHFSLNNINLGAHFLLLPNFWHLPINPILKIQ